ncbi:MAG: glucosamine-6-phosphate deaminase [Nanoarchaeota archaeon]
MKLIKVSNYSELSKLAAEIIIEQIKKKPNSVLGLATGQTPLGMYKELVKAYIQKKVDFSKVKTFNLDEYYNIKKTDKNSYHYYMCENFFSRVNVKSKNINMLHGKAKNVKQECQNYDKLLKQNPIDIQILGIGVNGHIGFDEPNSSFSSKTRLIDLTKSTIKRNSRFFKSKKQFPKHALTMGLSEIFKAKKIILLASGKAKKQIISKLIKSKPSEEIPASIIKKHKNSILIADKSALS